ncbi:MAG: Uma2 family endonuclease [Scytonema sp. PMC 1069.18]|nr:Uma2 family endonuclease [Scytonema sp. PMC 1069.18]MEC4885092.1 Uma2 family endonuclease [Scytonema sp. PMC 1070.18]
MTQAFSKTKLVTFDEFIAWYPENSERRYELHNGVIVEMPLPKGGHEKVVGFLVKKLNVEVDRLNLPYFVPKTVIVKPSENQSGYSPDVLLLDDSNLVNEPIWEQESIITQAASIVLAIEIVSTNWRDDYLKKYADYEIMGIPEYWMVDYLALGGREFIGEPKQPTISVCSLQEGEYRVTKFRGDDRIESPTFPDLNMTAQQIFKAGI